MNGSCSRTSSACGGWCAGLAAVVAMLAASSCATSVGDTGEPEAIVHAYYLDLRDPAGANFADVVDSTSLAAFKKRVIPVLSRGVSSSDTAVRAFVADLTRGYSLAKLNSMSPALFTRVILEAAFERMLGGEAMHGTIARPVGRVSQKADRVYVVVEMASESIRVAWPASEAVAVTLVRVGPSWRIKYPRELDMVAMAIERKIMP